MSDMENKAEHTLRLIAQQLGVTDPSFSSDTGLAGSDIERSGFTLDNGNRIYSWRIPEEGYTTVIAANSKTDTHCCFGYCPDDRVALVTDKIQEFFTTPEKSVAFITASVYDKLKESIPIVDIPYVTKDDIGNIEVDIGALDKVWVSLQVRLQKLSDLQYQISSKCPKECHSTVRSDSTDSLIDSISKEIERLYNNQAGPEPAHS